MSDIKVSDKPYIYVIVSGGVVQSAYSNVGGLEVDVIDLDDLEEDDIDSDEVIENIETFYNPVY